MGKKYRKTLQACYLAFITQAICANFAPLLFLKFHTDYEISLGQIALIPTVFFLTQLLVDVFCARFVDSIGYRRSAVASEVAAGLGLAGLAFIPDLFADPFVGIMICVVIYAIGSGLIEVLGSPIVEACPFEHKDAVMSLLHSFYCWGSVGVILLSTLFFAVFGIEHWKWLACIWALIPLYNIINFSTCPIEHLTLGFTKTVGDLAGPCLFAVTMGICRVFYGKYGPKMNLTKFMIGSGVLCLCCYLLASLSKNPVLGLIGCVCCGFSVGIMWPGTISITSPRIPKGGTALFALLAMAGDLGGAFGPGLVGTVTQQSGDNMQSGMLVGNIFPLVMIISLVLLTRMAGKKE